ncbi:hypothetical protein MKW98_001524 [Papaver atlanticum]|uniref:Uncharacterized protein n=1 Tax=Papaver atlanticum TaxID=357466 RepID=A0AAD4XAT9_9MAGN|nr:hypothetical protein MKW98_001524 [Papaver atlanticum]
MGIQGAEASIFTHQNHSAASKPSSSAGSSPKIVKDSEDKGVDDEITQTKYNIGIGKVHLLLWLKERSKGFLVHTACVMMLDEVSFPVPLVDD